MVPIVKCNQQEFGFNQFLKDITRKTQEAIREKRVLTHCVLVYSRANPIISKIIFNNRFYEALDEITNRYINIYHADSTPKTNTSQPTAKRFSYMRNLDSLNIYADKDKNREIIREMNKLFGLNMDDHNPVLFFFHLDGNDIKGNFCLEIEESDTDTTFLELKKIVLEVVAAVREVTNDNICNQFEIFNLAQERLKRYKLVKRIERVAANPLLNIALALK